MLWDYFSQQRRQEKRHFVNRRGAEDAEGFIVFVGATSVANNLSDRDEFAAEAAPTDREQINKTRIYSASSAPLRLCG